MKTENLQAMVEDYQRRTGETVNFGGFFFDDQGNFRDSYHEHFKFFPDVGFLFWGLKEYHGDMYFCILQTYGDMKVIGEYIIEVMERNNITKIFTSTTRKTKMHIRKWNMKEVPELDYTYHGLQYHVLEGTIDALR